MTRQWFMLAGSGIVVLLQWLIVMGFVSHSYLWWTKASDPQITVGIIGSVAMLGGVLAAVLIAIRIFIAAPSSQIKLRVLSLFVAVGGGCGQIVFWAMAGTGLSLLVLR